MKSWPAYPAYKPSGVEWLGDIPAHWNVQKLKHIASAQFSNVDKLTLEGELPVRLCNYTNVYYNDFITPDLDFMSATATPAEIAKFCLRRDDVIVTKDSETADDIAVPAYVTMDSADILCGYHLAQIRPRLQQRRSSALSLGNARAEGSRRKDQAAIRHASADRSQGGDWSQR